MHSERKSLSVRVRNLTIGRFAHFLILNSLKFIALHENPVLDVFRGFLGRTASFHHLGVDLGRIELKQSGLAAVVDVAAPGRATAAPVHLILGVNSLRVGNVFKQAWKNREAKLIFLVFTDPKKKRFVLFLLTRDWCVWL